VGAFSTCCQPLPGRPNVSDLNCFECPVVLLPCSAPCHLEGQLTYWANILCLQYAKCSTCLVSLKLLLSLAMSLLAVWLHPGAADEKALIASGEMTTWMQHAFGGDKTVMLPTAYSVNNSSSIHIPPNVLQDNSTGKWWSCPDFGYDITPCPTCQGPHMRCVSHYKLTFR
jgi:hypothetical protein